MNSKLYCDVKKAEKNTVTCPCGTRINLMKKEKEVANLRDGRVGKFVRCPTCKREIFTQIVLIPSVKK